MFAYLPVLILIAALLQVLEASAVLKQTIDLGNGRIRYIGEEIYDSDSNDTELVDDVSNSESRRLLGFRKKDITCEPVDWTQHKRAIKFGNSVIEFGQKTELIKTIRKYINRLTLNIDRTIPLKKSILGVEYTFDLVHAKIDIKGLKDMEVKPLQVVDADTLAFGSKSDSVLELKTKMKVNYTKEEKNFFGLFSYCPREMYFWRPCPQKSVKVDVTMVMDKLEMDAVADIKIMKCAKGIVNTLACRIRNTAEYLKALFRTSDNVLNSAPLGVLLKRIASVKVRQQQVRFDTSKVDAVVHLTPNVNDLSQKDIKLEIHNEVKEFFTQGIFKKAFFNAVSFASRKSANAAIAVIEPMFKGECVRR